MRWCLGQQRRQFCLNWTIIRLMIECEMAVFRSGDGEDRGLAENGVHGYLYVSLLLPCQY